MRDSEKNTSSALNLRQDKVKQNFHNHNMASLLINEPCHQGEMSMSVSVSVSVAV